jgi:hypothetical protein
MIFVRKLLRTIQDHAPVEYLGNFLTFGDNFTVRINRFLNLATRYADFAGRLRSVTAEICDSGTGGAGGKPLTYHHGNKYAFSTK